MKSRKKQTNEHVMAVTSLESNTYVNNENLVVQKPKKRKKHDRNSVEFISNDSTNVKICKNIIDESSENTIDKNFNKSMTKRKKRKNNELAGNKLENNSYLYDDNLVTQKHRKKKKHDGNYVESTFNYSTDPNKFKKLIKELSKDTIDINLNESVSKKKKRKTNELTDIQLEDNSCLYNDNNYIIQKPKRKKKHDRNSVESTSNDSTNVIICKNLTEESIKDTNDKISNEAKIKKKKRKTNELTDIKLEDNSCLYMDNYITQKPKKKKKHDRNSVESTSNYSTNVIICKILSDESTKDTNDKISNDTIFNESKTKKNDKLVTQKPEKKKKRKRNSVESTSIDSTNVICTNLTEESTKGTNDKISYEVNIKKKKRKTNELTDIKLEDNSYLSNDNYTTQKHKKKKNCNRNSIESTFNDSTNVICNNLAEKSTNDINDTIFNKSKTKKNDSLVTQKPKKKKKRDRNSVESTIDSTNVICTNLTEESTKDTNNTIFNEGKTKKKKRKSSELTDIKLENNSYLYNDNYTTQKPKKKKKRDRNSVESTSNDSTNVICNNLTEESTKDTNDTIFNESKTKKKKKHDRNSVESTSKYSTDPKICKKLIKELSEDTIYINLNEGVAKKKKHKTNEFANTTLDNENLIVQESNNKEKHDRNSIYSISNYVIQEKRSLRTKRKKVKSIQGSDSDETVTTNKKHNVHADLVRNNVTNIIKNIKSLQQDLTKSNDFILSENTNEASNNSNNNLKISANENSLLLKTKNDHKIDLISQDKTMLGEILQAIRLHELENSSTIVDKINLKEFDLINHVISASSLNINHSDFGPILKSFSTFVKKLMNSNVQMVTHSDIILLKFIFKKILEDIINVYNMSKIIENDLHIELPPECQNNKIQLVENSLSLNKEKMNLIKKLNPALKMGPFSKEEDSIIQKYWSKFEQEYNISDVQPFLTMRGVKCPLPREIKMQFIRYISAGLPNRLLYTVYKRFNVLYGKQANELSISENEDQFIILINNCEAIKNKLSLLSTLLNRSVKQIWRRIHAFKMKPLRGKYITWDLYKLQQLFTYILKETNTRNWKDLKDIKIKQDTWMRISKHFDEPINYEKCQTQWNFLKTRLFCERQIKYSTFKLNILELLLEINPKSWSDINWVDITNKLFPGAHYKVINTVFHWWTTKKVPKELRKDVKASLEYLSKNCLDSEVKKITDDREKQISRFTVDEDKNLLIEKD